MVMPQLSYANEQFYPHGLKSISKGREHGIRPSTPQLTAIGLLALLSMARPPCNAHKACDALDISLVVISLGCEMRQLQLTRWGGILVFAGLWTCSLPVHTVS